MATANPAIQAWGAAPRVNLMPRAESERRQRTRLAKRWIGALVGALLAVVVASGLAFGLQVVAAQRLAVEQARTTSLLGQLAELGEVQRALDLESDLRDFRAGAMATDFRWSPLIATVQQQLPAGVTLTGFSLAPGPVPQGDDPSAEVGVSGTVTLSSATPTEIVPLVRALRPMPAVLEADGWEATAEDGAYAYEIRIALDQSLYTGAYAEEDAE
ncbi:PilN domain-containing protein [Microbacterium sp. CPCC 204701]|uniref:PilN domain-containing protein n=1 Tax=Microbacterium sp. CPCC 204701 TaxID=2493084 RepID=UPI000FDBB8ED|nr:hypothetical protein [Microbacterium sp. CPCC 204701]